jgi:hypothetical protein
VPLQCRSWSKLNLLILPLLKISILWDIMLCTLQKSTDVSENIRSKYLPNETRELPLCYTTPHESSKNYSRTPLINIVPISINSNIYSSNLLYIHLFQYYFLI